MNRLSAFFSSVSIPSIPSALSAALLLAACAPESMTGSSPSDVRAHLDSASHRGSTVAKSDTATLDPDTLSVVGAIDSVIPTKPNDVAVADVPAVVTEPKDVTAADVPAVVTEPKDVTAPEIPPVVTKPDAPIVVADPPGSGKALEGAWKRVAHSITPGISVDGVLVTDLLMQDEAGSRDNLTEFKAGGVWTEDEGATKSFAQDDQSETGAWVMNADGSTLSLYPAGTPHDGEHFEFKVLEVSPTTLKVATATGAYSDNQPHSETITFTRQ